MKNVQTEMYDQFLIIYICYETSGVFMIVCGILITILITVQAVIYQVCHIPQEIKCILTIYVPYPYVKNK